MFRSLCHHEKKTVEHSLEVGSGCSCAHESRFNLSSGWGFTLVEVLVAVVILATGIVFVLRALDASVGALAEARDTMWATTLLREKTVLTTLAIRTESLKPPISRKGRFEGRYADFLWSEEVSLLPAPGPVVSCELITTVWRNGSNRPITAYTHVAIPERPPQGER